MISTSAQYNKQSYLNKINSLKQLKNNDIAFIRWNQANSIWQSVAPISVPNPYCGANIKTVSLNVLFDRISRQSMQYVLNSPERYAYILQKLGQIQADVIGLQEVTKLFFQMLLECDWARKSYWVSNFKQYQKGFGNMILTKIEPVCIQIIKVNGLPRYACTAFLPVLKQQQKQVEIVAFTSIHLVAYDKKHQIRQHQIEDLIKKLKKYQKIVADYVIQGDLNFHAEFQTGNMLKHGLTDCWLEKYDNNLKQYPGYTFDSDHNSLINQLYWGFQRRRMRLDRIFKLGNILQTQQMRVIFNEPVKGEIKEVDKYWFLRGGILFAADYFGWNTRSKTKQFLYPSDHFGLFVILAINKKSQKGKKFLY